MPVSSRRQGDHRLYSRVIDEKIRIVPIDIGANEMSPAYVLRIFRQFGFTDEEIKFLLKQQSIALSGSQVEHNRSEKNEHDE